MCQPDRHGLLDRQKYFSRPLIGDTDILVIHNSKLLDLLKYRYSLCDIHKISKFLNEQGTLDFPTLENGLFSAATVGEQFQYTGYRNVWVRDNIHIAYAHYIHGQVDKAKKNVRTLAEYFQTQTPRFEKIIKHEASKNEPMNRPHIRFNGENLNELDEHWAHAQNDALGYFLWMFCKMSQNGELNPTNEEMKLLALFPKYFNAVRFWEDEDNGHWEEVGKIEASSIGIATAGLRELKILFNNATLHKKSIYQGEAVSLDFICNLIDNGMKSLKEILPCECISESRKKPGEASTKREYDAALLFLIFPTGVVDNAMADIILHQVINNLQGEYGIRRYLKDSFWSPNYKEKLPDVARTADFSNDMSQRDSMINLGEEAQWCIFDPVISITQL